MKLFIHFQISAYPQSVLFAWLINSILQHLKCVYEIWVIHMLLEFQTSWCGNWNIRKQKLLLYVNAIIAADALDPSSPGHQLSPYSSYRRMGFLSPVERILFHRHFCFAGEMGQN